MGNKKWPLIVVDAGHGGDARRRGVSRGRAGLAGGRARIFRPIHHHARIGLGCGEGDGFTAGFRGGADSGGLLPRRHGLECRDLSRPRRRAALGGHDHVLDLRGGVHDAIPNQVARGHGGTGGRGRTAVEHGAGGAAALGAGARPGPTRTMAATETPKYFGVPSSSAVPIRRRGSR